MKIALQIIYKKVIKIVAILKLGLYTVITEFAQKDVNRFFLYSKGLE